MTANRVCTAGALGLAVLLGVTACGSKDIKPEGDGAPKDLKYGQKVRGKVTYKGEPVVYGAVLFYSPDRSFNPNTKTFAPTASGEIREDGSYTIENAAFGPMLIVVATDPDIDTMQFVRPSGIGGGPPVGPGMPGGGMPGGEPPSGGPPGGPPGGGPPGVGPPGGGPPGVGPPGLPPGAPKPPGFDPNVGKLPNPRTEKLTEAQKKVLKEIHEKFGTLGKSPIGSLQYVVIEGEQTHNIELK